MFAIFTINELSAGPPNPAMPTSFGASPTEAEQRPVAQSGAQPLQGLTGTDPSKFIPIDRPNPHPGQFPSFMRADPYGQVPYQQPAAGNEVWEFCAYRVLDASLTDLIAHYDKQAKLVGMKLIKQKPTSDNKPGGITTSWSDGRRGLNVTAWPTPNTRPAAPPLRPPTPLQWVVRYSYPTLAR